MKLVFTLLVTLHKLHNTAVTETASEILGKHRQKRKPWITAEILDLCDKRRELRKKDSSLKELQNIRK